MYVRTEDRALLSDNTSAQQKGTLRFIAKEALILINEAALSLQHKVFFGGEEGRTVPLAPLMAYE